MKKSQLQFVLVLGTLQKVFISEHLYTMLKYTVRIMTNDADDQNLSEFKFLGYRLAVLNHIGVIDTIQVTSPRIFTYGHTDDYVAMIASLVKKYPSTHIISVGFSLGGNLITKYLGETNVVKPKNIIGGISICQGYNANLATQCLLKW